MFVFIRLHKSTNSREVRGATPESTEWIEERQGARASPAVLVCLPAEVLGGSPCVLVRAVCHLAESMVVDKVSWDKCVKDVEFLRFCIRTQFKTSSFVFFLSPTDKTLKGCSLFWFHFFGFVQFSCNFTCTYIFCLQVILKGRGRVLRSHLL